MRLDHDLDLVALGARSGMLWRRDGFVMAGMGVAQRIPIDRAAGQAGAAEAQGHLAALRTTDTIALPGSGPVAFAAMPFEPTAASELVVPQALFVRGREGRRWATLANDRGPADDAAVATAVDQAVALTASASAAPQPVELELRSVLSPEAWRDHVVGGARDRIRAGELSKAVLARELRLRADAPLDHAAIIERLAAVHPTAIVFALEGFVGASPELLVARTDDVVRAHPLAGTAARASDPALDQQQVAGLLASDKDRWEHQITIDWLLDELLPFCSFVDAEPNPSIVSLPNVHHLGTRVEGRLSAPPASVLELVAALHPTPAVGGDPQDAALRLISELESAERGRYAGPTGWVDSRGNGAFCVAIRSAQLRRTDATLFAGVGVVADSDPEAELAETRAKFQAMLAVLLRP